jgi:hypothetical protein
MAFEDVARRLSGGRKGGVAPRSAVDPDQIVAGAVAANRRSDAIRDLVLGSVVVVGGRVIAVLAAPPSGRHTADAVLRIIALGVSLLGAARLVRGLIRLVTASSGSPRR